MPASVLHAPILISLRISLTYPIRRSSDWWRFCFCCCCCRCCHCAFSKSTDTFSCCYYWNEETTQWLYFTVMKSTRRCQAENASNEEKKSTAKSRGKMKKKEWENDEPLKFGIHWYPSHQLNQSSLHVVLPALYLTLWNLKFIRWGRDMFA